MLDRRQILMLGAQSALMATSPAAAHAAQAQPVALKAVPTGIYNVCAFGAVGDGTTINSSAIQRAIEAASAAGGGVIHFPAGVYASFSIRLKSHVSLYLDCGATLLAAPTSQSGVGYDAPEPQGGWESYQDYGHNHWQNSLIWGDGIHDFSIEGPGLIWGKGLSRGYSNEPGLPEDTAPGAGNKAIALKNCYNVTLRDFSILQGGWFGVLATGVDNLTIDNLRIDTNRDGIDIDCCRNVRVSNCTVNSPWDDGICPKSSFALGYARPTENLTISNCFVTGSYELGSVLDGTWKRLPASFTGTGRIKCGTESNGGFRNITISNCVFEHSRGFALETVDGALCEDITFVGVTMRGTLNSPFFLRLGRRMRGPADVPAGRLRRILISNVTSSGAMRMPSILAGVPGFPIEDVKISDLYMQQTGGEEELNRITPPELETEYPEPDTFGPIPASGFFLRHIRNLEATNIEIATLTPDRRPAFALVDVEGADFFRVRTPKSAPGSASGSAFTLQRVSDFRLFGSQSLADHSVPQTDGLML